MNTTIADSLRSILAEMKSRPVQDVVLGEEDNFLEVLGLDSLDSVDLIARISDTFGIEFGNEVEDIDALQSFGGLVRQIEARKAS